MTDIRIEDLDEDIASFQRQISQLQGAILYAQTVRKRLVEAGKGEEDNENNEDKDQKKGKKP